MPIGLPGEADESIQGMIGRRKMAWPRYNLDVEQRFSSSAIVYCNYHHLRSCFECVSPKNLQQLTIDLVVSSLRENAPT